MLEDQDCAWPVLSHNEDARGSVRIVDLFSGCGVLTEGLPWTSY